MKILVSFKDLPEHVLKILDHGFVASFIAFYLSLYAQKKQLRNTDTYEKNIKIKNMVNNNVNDAIDVFINSHRVQTNDIIVFLNFKTLNDDILKSGLNCQDSRNIAAYNNVMDEMSIILVHAHKSIDMITESAIKLKSDIKQNNIYFKDSSIYSSLIQNSQDEIDAYIKSTIEISKRVSNVREAVFFEKKVVYQKISEVNQDLKRLIKPTYEEQFKTIYELIKETNTMIYYD